MKRMWKKSLFFVGTVGGSRTEDGEEATLGEDRREGRPSSPRREQGMQGRRSRVTRRRPPRRGNFFRVPAAPPHPLRRFLLLARERLLPCGGRDARCRGRLLRRARGARGVLRLRPSLQQDAHLEGERPAGRGRLRSPRRRRTFRRLLVPGGTLRPGPRELSPLAEELHASLSSLSCVLASASSPGPHLCAARVITRSASAPYRTLNEYRTVARAYLELPPAAREVW